MFPLACPCVSVGSQCRAVLVDRPDAMLLRRVTETATATVKTGSVKEMTTSNASARQSERSVKEPTPSQRSSSQRSKSQSRANKWDPSQR